MSPIQEINWNNFKTKFNEKEQSSFEWLCYLLFCNEFKQNIGIPRYKNQAGIETDPIKINGKQIGWQAKFYDTRLSEHKGDFKKSIKTTKSKYPNINKIIFYINQDFSQGKKENDPKYKTEIENYAVTNNIEIEWRTKSFFESPFVCEENATIVQHFFDLGKSVIDFINELTQHTESILKPIHSKITFSDNEIKIDRSEVIDNLGTILNESPVVILSGKGGVGKTAVIKDFYNLLKEKSPIFVFKAIEFNIFNINQIFKAFGDFTLSDFIKEHQSFTEKYIVIDSAEKLSDIERQEVFQEFLSLLLDSNWKIIFTTRHSYLDDLKYQLIEFYKLKFQPLNINNLTEDELIKLSKKYKFNLPNNERLRELLLKPFYLNEYLQYYNDLDSTISFTDFKNALWEKQINKSSYRNNNTHIKREDCFLKIAQKRANTGNFFVKVDDCDDGILNRLISDEIIEYDKNAGGYFISQDIYEEWAFDKIIERGFRNSENHRNFYQNIGSSLPIRRAFRNWLSEKLFFKKEEIKSLIEATINDEKIESYWKDEILVSVMLSDYSENFIQLFKNKLLENNQEFLIKIIFLLRIACKEIDEDFLNLLGISKTKGIALKTLFTRPKGSGWICVINFINKHKEALGENHINIILPLLYDWNNKYKQGETTKNASQIALFLYDKITKDGGFSYRTHSETKEQLIKTILNGSFEIKEELTNIFNQVIEKKEIDHRSKYNALIHTVLSSLTDSCEIVKYLPEQVLNLADLFWYKIPDETDYLYGSSIGVEENFCLADENHHDYYPSSALQTPILQLLWVSNKQTLDFILSFTNKTVECYSKSRLKYEIEEIEIFIDENESITQYINNRLWNMYRGTQVSTCLLESIHMALEKWMLEYAKIASEQDLEKWCLYLIKNSKSASITAVVTSVMLSQPGKLFNIAKLLFQTKELFYYDTSRLILDQQQKNSLLMLRNSFGIRTNFMNEIYENERITACDDAHRGHTLENIAINYQLFRSEGESEKEAKKRQEIIWEIFDKYYEKLPEKSKETDSDMTWRLYLARMDSRKMHPTTEEKEGQVLISLNPDIDPDLKKYSEDSLKKSSEPMKYSSLRLWSNYRFDRNEKEYKKYKQYEDKPLSVITEVKEIIEGLKDDTDKNFSLFNRSIPAYASAVLIRDFDDILNQGNRKFCKKVIIDYAEIPLKSEHFSYQISDGTEPSIVILPQLVRMFPKDNKKIKSLIFLLLLNPWKEISTFAARGILNTLWDISYEDAHSIFLGYLLLKPKYKKLMEIIREENYENNIYELSATQILKRFKKEHVEEIKKVMSNEMNYDELTELDNASLGTLNTAFELLPLKTEHEVHKRFLEKIFKIISKKIFKDDDKTDYTLKHRFLEKYACFILSRNSGEIEVYIKPFVDNFTDSRDMADFFQEFVLVEDKLNEYEKFWIVWDAFYNKIVELCQKESSYIYTKEIVHNYLLAWPYWEKDAKEWHTLKDREKLFFKKVVEDIGHQPSVLYSISKLLNEIGSKFIDDGVVWISDILQKTNKMDSEKLEINTIYYIENIVRRYILRNRYKVKTTIQLKNQIIVILNFLFQKGSVTGYLLREDIL